MREILFRGLTEYGQWVEGYLSKDEDKYYISKSFESFIEVIPETVGQYTGLCDRSGTKIFEGDCIGHKLNAVEMLDGEWCVNGDRPLWMFKGYEVVGNIYGRKGELKP